MGVMLLVFTPVPYVDASAASGFREKWQRIVVGAAGMVVELFLAAGRAVRVATRRAGPGPDARLQRHPDRRRVHRPLQRQPAAPLRRLLHARRSAWRSPTCGRAPTGYLGYLCERYLFGRRGAAPVPSTAGRAGLVRPLRGDVVRLPRPRGGGHLAVSRREALPPRRGVRGGAASSAGSFVPAGKALVYFASSPRIRTRALRAITVTVVLIALVGGAVGLVPVPYRSRAEGVIWVPEEALVRASADGFITRVLAKPGARVTPRDSPSSSCATRLLPRAHDGAGSAADRSCERATTSSGRPTGSRADVIREELAYVTQQTRRTCAARMGELTVRAAAAGTFVVPVPEDLPGRFVRKGELLGYAVELGDGHRADRGAAGRHRPGPTTHGASGRPAGRAPGRGRCRP